MNDGAEGLNWWMATAGNGYGPGQQKVTGLDATAVPHAQVRVIRQGALAESVVLRKRHGRLWWLRMRLNGATRFNSHAHGRQAQGAKGSGDRSRF
jgi:hypothetical protein